MAALPMEYVTYRYRNSGSAAVKEAGCVFEPGNLNCSPARTDTV
jgi:hypothetical protein